MLIHNSYMAGVGDRTVRPIVWIVWLVVCLPFSETLGPRVDGVPLCQLIPTFYFSGLIWLRRQYRQEREMQAQRDMGLSPSIMSQKPLAPGERSPLAPGERTP